MAMNTLFFDLRQSLRAIAHAPLFSASLIILLALGIGANTLIFTAVDVLLLRPLAVSHPEELIRFGVQISQTYTYYDHPYLYARILRARGQSFTDVFVSWPMEMSFASGNRLESITGETVSGNFFSALGLTANLGRVLTDEDELEDASVAVISYSFWQQAFAGRKDVIGQTIYLRDNPFIIIGVLPQGFVDLDLENRPDVWVPMSAWKLWTTKPDNTLALSRIYMRMRPGVNVPQAEAEVRALYPMMLTAFYQGRPGGTPDVNEKAKSMPPAVTSIRRGVSAMRKQFAGAVGVLMGGVGTLLLLVCANTGGLMLARAETKRREVAIRMSLGASRWTILWRTLLESLFISGVGATAGWFIARMCGPLLVRFLPARRPLGIELTPDLRVLAFVTVACVITAGLISIIPALNVVRTDLSAVMGRQSGRASGRPIARGLVAFQVTLATALLAGSLALVRTLEAIRAQDPGFRRDKLVVLTVNPRMAGVKTDEIPRIFDELLRRATSLPGVEAASLAEKAPMHGLGLKATVLPTGSHVTLADSLNVSLNSVSVGHFDNIGMHILEGRGFEPSDKGHKPGLAVVSASFARQFFPGVDPIGRTFGSGGVNAVTLPEYEIVGVVNDSKYRSMREIPPPTFYLLIDDNTLRFSDGMALYVSVRGDPAQLVQELQGMLREIGPGIAPTSIATMEQEIETSLWQERLLAALTSIFATLSAVLAGIGLFGMLAYGVSQRRREIGIRMSVGATVERIAKLIAMDAAWTVVPGILGGFVAYAACSRALASLLYGVTRWDVASIIGAVVFVVVASAVATVFPALNAARIEPWQVLREE